jgi:hypothetical protein
MGEANMKRHVAVWPLVLSLGIIVLGCDAPPPVANSSVPAPPNPPGPPPPPGSEPAVASAPSAAPAPSGQAPLPLETKFGAFAGSINDLAARPQATPSPTSAAPSQNTETERVKAEKGVGIKGRSLDQYEGVLVTPAKAYFAARERIFFEIEFKGNYDRWRVLADKAPQDFDELKAQFLDPMGLTGKLPKLPQGHKYVWDAAAEELQVERPKRQ